MPNTSRSSTADERTRIVSDFFHHDAKDADKWTPEERAAKEQILADRLGALSMRQIAETSRILRQEIVSMGDIGIVRTEPAHPEKKKMTASQLVDEIAASINFG